VPPTVFNPARRMVLSPQGSVPLGLPMESIKWSGGRLPWDILPASQAMSRCKMKFEQSGVGSLYARGSSTAVHDPPDVIGAPDVSAFASDLLPDIHRFEESAYAMSFRQRADTFTRTNMLRVDTTCSDLTMHTVDSCIAEPMRCYAFALGSVLSSYRQQIISR
jgi:hypothetical protein